MSRLDGGLFPEQQSKQFFLVGIAVPRDIIQKWPTASQLQ
jgi:hypothetical protein